MDEHSRQLGTESHFIIVWPMRVKRWATGGRSVGLRDACAFFCTISDTLNCLHNMNIKYSNSEYET